MKNLNKANVTVISGTGLEDLLKEIKPVRVGTRTRKKEEVRYQANFKRDDCFFTEDAWLRLRTCLKRRTALRLNLLC